MELLVWSVFNYERSLKIHSLFPQTPVVRILYSCTRVFTNDLWSVSGCIVKLIDLYVPKFVPFDFFLLNNTLTANKTVFLDFGPTGSFNSHNWAFGSTLCHLLYIYNLLSYSVPFSLFSNLSKLSSRHLFWLKFNFWTHFTAFRFVNGCCTGITRAIGSTSSWLSDERHTSFKCLIHRKKGTTCRYRYYSTSKIKKNKFSSLL